MAVQPAVDGKANILVVAGGESPELVVLEKLPEGAKCVTTEGSPCCSSMLTYELHAWHSFAIEGHEQ